MQPLYPSQSLTSFLYSNSTQIYLLPSHPHPFSLSNIQTLSLRTLTISDTIALLSHCPSLTSLTISSLSPLSADIFHTLCQFKNLQSLTASFQDKIQIKQNKIPLSLKMKVFRVKNLPEKSKVGVGKDIVEVICKVFPNLEVLREVRDLSSSRVAAMKGLKGLREVEVMKFSLSEGELDTLTKKLPHLTSLVNCNLTDSHIKILSDNLSLISSLDISQNPKLTLKSFTHLKKHSPTLVSLNITSLILDKESLLLNVLSNFKKLKQLKVSDSQLSKRTLNEFPRYFQSLERFIVWNSYQVVNDGDVDIRGFVGNARGLKELSINKGSKNKNVIKIVENNPALESLALRKFNTPETSIRFDNAGCFYVSKLKKLKYLFFNGENVKEGGVMKVLRNLSGLNFRTYFPMKMEGKTRRNTKIMRWTRHMGLNLYVNP